LGLLANCGTIVYIAWKLCDARCDSYQIANLGLATTSCEYREEKERIT
jgi:hypothetical protein